MYLLNLVITKSCGQRLSNSIFVGYGAQCLERRAYELRREIPFQDSTIEGFIYQPGGGWQKDPLRRVLGELLWDKPNVVERMKNECRLLSSKKLKI